MITAMIFGKSGVALLKDKIHETRIIRQNLLN